MASQPIILVPNAGFVFDGSVTVDGNLTYTGSLSPYPEGASGTNSGITAAQLNAGSLPASLQSLSVSSGSTLSGGVTLTGAATLGGSAIQTASTVSTTLASYAPLASPSFTGAVSMNGDVVFSPSGVGPPTYSTRSLGTRLVLTPDITSGSTDFGMGIDSSTMWSSVPGPALGFFFKWYGGTSVVASLDGTGNMILYGGPGTGSSTASGTLSFPTANANIVFSGSSTGPPTTSTRSNGTRIVLQPTVNSGNVDVGIGVDAQVMWFSIGDGSQPFYYKFYGGPTVAASIDGSGNVIAHGSLTLGNTGTKTVVSSDQSGNLNVLGVGFTNGGFQLLLTPPTLSGNFTVKLPTTSGTLAIVDGSGNLTVTGTANIVTSTGSSTQLAISNSSSTTASSPALTILQPALPLLGVVQMNVGVSATGSNNLYYMQFVNSGGSGGSSNKWGVGLGGHSLGLSLNGLGAVNTQNNTLDNGSGTMIINSTASGQQLRVYQTASTTTESSIVLGYVPTVGGTPVPKMVVGWNGGNGCFLYDYVNAQFWIQQGGTTAGNVQTKNNTLDDGTTGNATFAGTVKATGKSQYFGNAPTWAGTNGNPLVWTNTANSTMRNTSQSGGTITLNNAGTYLVNCTVTETLSGVGNGQLSITGSITSGSGVFGQSVGYSTDVANSTSMATLSTFIITTTASAACSFAFSVGSGTPSGSVNGSLSIIQMV